MNIQGRSQLPSLYCCPWALVFDAQFNNDLALCGLCACLGCLDSRTPQRDLISYKLMV